MNDIYSKYICKKYLNNNITLNDIKFIHKNMFDFNKLGQLSMDLNGLNTYDISLSTMNRLLYLNNFKNVKKYDLNSFILDLQNELEYFIHDDWNKKLERKNKLERILEL